MSERRVYLSIVVLIVLALVVVTVSYALRYMDAFAVDRITVVGMERIPDSVSRLLAACYGVNRFRLDVDDLVSSVEENPLVDQCIVSWSLPAHMEVTLIPSDEKCLLYDGQSYYLMDEGRPVALSGEDSAAYAAEMCTVDVSTSLIGYMQRYSSPSSFDQVLDLIERVNETSSWLITRIKYDNNTTSGFGQIVLTLEPLNSRLYVRERVSAQRIGDSIRVIQASIEDDPAGALRIGMRRWDLYSDALVRRDVEKDG